VRNIEFKRVGRGEREAKEGQIGRFMELGKAEMDGIGMVWRIGVLGTEEFPVEITSKRDKV
jgi:hypothetical protein